MASYAVKEMFVTLQGEGLNAGRRALFMRFSGCNLWSGREEDRAGAECTFCDTDFVGMNGDHGGRYAGADELADKASALWCEGLEEGAPCAFVVLTGGEPLLQVDAALIDALHARNFEIAVETNGTIAAPPGIDWICVSPKAGTEIVQRSGDELKLVWPQPGVDPDAMESWAFRHHLVQPMDGPGQVDNRNAALKFVYQHPRWRLSLQTHKLIGLP
ncbi:7-carboxy-7-deazaguanine synthase [Sphingomonas quercus]|uniref:7-carboxy-7-deazaguanine synthase n=1 Tax=Sphingomonas quercus TaxID=2842451 RepID=A0ABS6BEJ9_9SPHN|nr:7-carboxy-7-deazaguanine synthase [Sphingomonas quercus]MBU3076741.1 7-carboxy-7-deazaguanine synthase [Sphingomonas quercus]